MKFDPTRSIIELCLFVGAYDPLMGVLLDMGDDMHKLFSLKVMVSHIVDIVSP